MIKKSVHAGKKFLYWTTVSIAVFMFILLSLHFLIPKIISLEPVREKIKAGISQRIAGAVDFRTMEVSLLPRPKAVIRDGRFSLPGKAEVSFDSASVAPRVLPLLEGKVRIGRIQLYAPHVSLILPEREEEDKTPLSMEEMKKKLAAVLNTLASHAGGIKIDIEKGVLDISDKDRTLFSLRDLDGRIVLPPEDLSITLACRSGMSESITLGLKLNPASFNGLGTLTLRGAKPRLILHGLLPKLAGYIGDSEGDMTLSFTINGLDDIRAEVQSSFAKMTLLNKGEKIPLTGIDLSGGAMLAKDVHRLTVKELKIKDPRLTMRGSLVLDKGTGNISLEVSGSHMDMLSLRRTSLAAAGEVSIVRDIFSYVRGGEVPFVTVRSQGGSVEELGRTENIFITSAIQGGDIFIPGPRLGFTEVNAECVISKGILDAKNVLATIGKTKVSDCTVKVGLKGRDVPLHIDAAVKADLLEAKDILRRTIKNQEFINEADRVHRIEGKASGRIVLGENTASLKPRIDLSELSFTADYQRIPFPVTVRRGEFSYTDTRVGIRKLDGTLGRSSFKDLASELRLGNAASLEISSGDLRIEQNEFFPWLKSLEALKGPLEGVRSMGGVVNLNVLHLAGPLGKPSTWRFKVAGSIEDLSLDSVFSPEPVFLKKGRIMADEEMLALTDSTAEVLDGRLVISGTHQGYAGDRPVTELNLRGEMGPRFLGWAARLAGLPSQLSLRDPLMFERAHIVLGEGAVLFEGKWKIEEGPEISASVFKDPKGLAIKGLTINDASSDVTLSANIQEKIATLDFAGKLSSETLNKLISAPFRGGKITGDFRAEIRQGKPLSFHSRGRLGVDNISFLLKEELPLTVENLSMAGDGSRLSIESTSLILDGNPFSLRGTLESTPQAAVIDMDLSAEQIIWEKIAETAEKLGEKKDEETDKEWDLAVEGSVRLNANSFSYGKYTLMPLAANMALRRNAVDIIITRSSLCDISFSGNVGVAPAALSMDLQLSAANAELEHALACFDVADREMLTGTFDLLVSVKAQGKKEDLLNSLTGKIDFTARSGRIYHELSLMKIFDFLEVTQILRGLPQMRQEGVEYKSITARGELAVGLLDIKEVVMDCPSLKIAAQGSVDLKQEKMDLGVLVCPFKRTNAIIRKIPVIGGILGGGFASIPLKVTGDLSAPKVSSNPVSAVGAGLLGILGRTIQAPVKLFDPFLKDAEKE